MDKYRIICRESGDWIDSTETLEDAKALVEEFETEDKEDGVYTPDFYEIEEVETI